jgi:hypothetical protein
MSFGDPIDPQESGAPRERGPVDWTSVIGWAVVVILGAFTVVWCVKGIGNLVLEVIGGGQ